MKKSKKLEIKKVTLRNLDEPRLEAVVGGLTATCVYTICIGATCPFDHSCVVGKTCPPTGLNC